MDQKWWKQAIGYEIYPRSFKDTMGDGNGDLKGILSKMDYLEELGVNLLWICPFFKSPMDDNGYDISDHYQVNEMFGDLEDIKKLIRVAHKKNMKIILDFVMNHTSDEHPWFQEVLHDPTSDKKDYYIFKKGKNNNMTPPNNWGGYFSESVWTFSEEVNEWYLHLFSKKMPDLNWENPKLRKEIYEIARFWLDLGCDGFRLDAIAHLSKNETFADSKYNIDENGIAWDFDNFSNRPRLMDYLNEFKQEVLDHYDCVTIGEVGGCATCDQALVYANYENGPLNMAFNFDTCWQNGAYGADDKTDDEIVTDLINMKEIHLKWFEAYKGKAWMPLYWLNHDHPRVLSQYGNIQYRYESATMLMTTLLFMYGTPFIYFGDEIGMSNVTYDQLEDFNDVSAKNYIESAKGRRSEYEMLRHLRRASRVNARCPMQWDDTENAGFTKGKPWLKVNNNYKDVNVKNQINDPDSILSFTKKAIQIRKNWYNDFLVEADFEIININHPDVYCYLRRGTKKLVVLSNFRNTEIVFKLDLSINEVVLHNYSDEMIDKNTITLRPFECYLFEVTV